MKRIGITGAEGFLGWHLRAYLHSRGIAARCATRATFSSSEELAEFAGQCDAIIHLAGMNRGGDVEIERTNVALTEQLISACTVTGRCRHILFSNSTHVATRDTAYARSKRACAGLLQQWADSRGAIFNNLILPQIFGEGGRPFYNSAVSTFCHQLAVGDTPKIIRDAELELLHAQRAAEYIYRLIERPEAGEARPAGTALTVTELLRKLSEVKNFYGAQLIPPLQDNFELDLFNTYRSYLFPQHYPVLLSRREDERGSLFEAVKSLHGGQCFISTTKPGVTRGNHYHRHKIERFLVLGGEATIRVRKLFAPQAVDFPVSGDMPQYVDMPALHTHSITNTGVGELVTLFWSHEIFDPEQPDTYMETV